MITRAALVEDGVVTNIAVVEDTAIPDFGPGIVAVVLPEDSPVTTAWIYEDNEFLSPDGEETASAAPPAPEVEELPTAPVEPPTPDAGIPTGLPEVGGIDYLEGQPLEVAEDATGFEISGAPVEDDTSNY